MTKEVMDIINNINTEGTTVIIVTHDAKVAARASRIIYLTDGNIHDELALGVYSGEKAVKMTRERRLDDWLEKQGF
jgi:putative ABC transport system ATP-binding protein